MPKLVIRLPDGTETSHAFDESLTVGRAEGNDVVVSAGGVSRKHARFTVEAGVVLVEDVGSANGTFVDGEQISEPTPVRASSVVSVGDSEIRLEATALAKPKPKRGTGDVPRSNTKAMASLKSGARPSSGARPRASPSASPQLKGMSEVVKGAVFKLSGTAVVGRVAGVEVQIEDDSVSRRHAELQVEGGAVVVRDLGSANGTSVNGAVIDGDVTLSPGDVVQFGVVELLFESSGGSKAMARAKPAAIRRPVAADDDDDDGDAAELADLALGGGEPTAGAQGSRTKLLIVVGLLAVGSIVAVAVLHSDSSSDAQPFLDKPMRPGLETLKSENPEERLETLLAACRQYSSTEFGEPNFAKAEEACLQVLELEPIHKEGNELMKKIQVGRACEDNLRKARELVSTNRAEESLDFFARVRPDCGYFLAALTDAKAPVEEVKRLAGTDCKQYATAGKWENALKRCEVYARLACQVMGTEERYPPPLMKLKLDGALGKTGWRPKDPLYVNFLKARDRMRPGDPMWQCPDIPVFRPPQAAEDPSRKVKEEFAKRYPDPDMGRAVGLYFDGKFQEMVVPLQKIQENMSKAELHDQARTLAKDLTSISSHFATGSTEINNDKPERAEEPFRRALELDEKLMLAELKAPADDVRRRELERRKSFVRRSIIETMTSSCYQKGKIAADRNDFRQACKMWKLGMSFSKSNIDLLRALTNVCTKKAGEVLKSANRCEMFRSVLDYAVDGDPYKEKAIQALAEHGCSGG
ncbi:MAG: FHA domain-containing protein [Archangium sp.]|nr:FHA domain-containing protein [Archangium sp.]